MSHRFSIRLAGRTVAALALAALSACGGGGGDAPTASPTTPASPAAPTAPANPSFGTESALVTNVPAVTYTGEALAAFDVYQSERSRCGFGLVAQNTALDNSAADSNTYWLARVAESQAAAAAFAHLEDPGKSGFTGVSPEDRASFRGYQYSYAGESVAQTWGSSASGHGARQMRALLSTVYHSLGMMSGVKEVGISARSAVSAANATGTRLVVTVGIPAQQQAQGQGLLRTFPCEGSTNANASFTPSNESPNPAPDVGSAAVGTPIVLASPLGTAMSVTSYEIRAAGSASPLQARLITSSNDPGSYMTQAMAALLPLTPLTPGTPYQVSITATVNGTPVTRSFTFTPMATEQ